MKKKLFTLIVSCALFALLCISANAYIAGDTDNDFLVTASDARFALRLSVGLEQCEKDSDQYKASDANNDGTVTASDARTILRVSVGLEKFVENTENKHNILITKTPYSTNGLVVNSIKLEDSYFVLNITNKNGKTNLAVSSSSYLPYKFYNSKGDVIYSGTVYMQQLRNGESCNVKIYERDGAAKLIFGSAVIKLIDAPVEIKTEVVDGITINKAPFTVDGIKVTKITVDKENSRMYVEFTNTTSSTLSGSIYFNAYDKAGNSLTDRGVSFSYLAPGEKMIESFSILNATKVVFNKSTVSTRESFTAVSKTFKDYSGVTLNQFPFKSGGLEFSFVSINTSGYSPKLTIKIKNTNSYAVSDSSRLYYKEYDANGYFINRLSNKIVSLNPGESMLLEISLSKNTKKAVFGDISVEKGDTVSYGKTSVISSITTNASFVNTQGVKITEFSVRQSGKYNYITIKITNNSGKAITSSTAIYYKALTADNLVMTSATTYLPCDLNNGESTYKEILLTNEETKVYFFIESVSFGSTFTPLTGNTVKTGGLTITAPTSSNGLEIKSYSVSDGKLYVRITNKTGSAVKGSSYFTIKLYDTNGNVIRTSILNTTQMNKDESCEVYINLPDSAAKVLFGTAKVIH